MKKYFVMDVGGTQLKSCLLDENGGIVSDILLRDSKAKESKEEILQNFYEAIAALVETSREEVSGLAFAFPGEFDYENGISLICGLDKYDSVYGVNLKKEFRKMICRGPLCGHCRNPEKMPILFINDVEAFAVGAAKEDQKALALAIGTGAGSAFVDGGKAAPKGCAGVPENGMLYDKPFLGKRMDDWLSKRGLMELSEKMTGKKMDGAELAGLAVKGNVGAKEVYREFGRLLETAVHPYLLAFAPDTCVLGGQIMKSFPLFGNEIEQLCTELGIQLEVITKTSEMTFQGLYKMLKQNADSIEER